VPELVPEDVARNAHMKLDQAAPIATPGELADYDAIIVGTPTRYGRMTSQMANFWDQTGGLWVKGALVGKVGSAFTSTATQHGGQETTLFSIITNLLHQGMIIVGLPYSFQGQMRLDEITGGTPYGASTLAGVDFYYEDAACVRHQISPSASFVAGQANYNYALAFTVPPYDSTGRLVLSCVAKASYLGASIPSFSVPVMIQAPS